MDNLTTKHTNEHEQEEFHAENAKNAEGIRDE
jgi:hypothetical protein